MNTESLILAKIETAKSAEVYLTVTAAWRPYITTKNDGGEYQALATCIIIIIIIIIIVLLRMLLVSCRHKANCCCLSYF
jgi:hypothetical protein